MINDSLKFEIASGDLFYMFKKLEGQLFLCKYLPL